MKNKNFVPDKKIHTPISPPYITSILKSKKGTKEIYPIFNKNTDEPTAKARWQSILDIDNDSWPDIYNSPFKSTKSTQLQWLQIRINHNILPTRKYLHRIKATDSPNCMICPEVETVVHMLWLCPETKHFLIQFLEMLSGKNITLKLNQKQFILNIGINLECDLSLCLILKEYIFTSKFHKKPLMVSVALHRFKQHYKSLKYSAVKANKFNIFSQNWNKYNNILE